MSEQTQAAAYNDYVARVTAKNVQPTVFARDERQADLDGEVWEETRGKDALSPRWGDACYGSTRVWVSNLGRVMEVQSVDRGWSTVRAVHASKDDFYAYRRPLDMWTYLNG